MSEAAVSKSASLRTGRMKDGRRLLLRDLVVEVEGIPIDVPEGSKTDFSSISWIGWFALRVGGWIAWNRYPHPDPKSQPAAE